MKNFNVLMALFLVIFFLGGSFLTVWAVNNDPSGETFAGAFAIAFFKPLRGAILLPLVVAVLLIITPSPPHRW